MSSSSSRLVDVVVRASAPSS